MLKTIYYPEPAAWPELCRRPQLDSEDLWSLMTEIFDQVTMFGDEAVKRFVRLYENVELPELEVSEAALASAGAGLTVQLKEAIATALANIETFHRNTLVEPPIIETMPGIRCWIRKKPINKVGLYVPGGSAPLFSTVLMLAVPAAIAGCSEVVLCTPVNKSGKVNEAVLYAARLAGVHRVFAVGGAQAIAAMAIGTSTIPKVDKIFGPGNQYVTAAKQYAGRVHCAIDLPAGPSEVLVIADVSAKPEYVAADLLSQAEHGADSQVILLTDSMRIVDEVNKAIEQQLAQLPRADVASQALTNSLTILLRSTDEAMKFSNLYAPEHLILATSDAEKLAEKVMHAGSVFVGHYSPESAGDYATGTNHTLPTYGFARSMGGLTIDSFLKTVTFQQLTYDGLSSLAHVIKEMASAENLEAHKRAVDVRLRK
ncbi:MAG TPA: histidinol dehydrogenase [Bacteroidales bacterium]|nr:histidinol dehydrogenase [Bacteroidales bacterium]